MYGKVLVLLCVQVITAAPKQQRAECTDVLPNCQDYGQEICNNPDYKVWISSNCMKYCNKCPTSPTTGSVGMVPSLHTSTCTDDIPNCADYGQAVCNNHGYAEWVKQNCPKFCDICPSAAAAATTTTTTRTTTPRALVPQLQTSTCTDTLPNCAAYGQAICSNPDYPVWVETNCKQFCNKCPHGGVPMIPTTVPTTTTTAASIPVPAGGTTCVDRLTNCAVYGLVVCTDANYKTWTALNCPKFCSVCNASLATPPVPVATSCVDKMPNCKDYGLPVCSNADYGQWAAQNCPQFCNKCPTSGSGVNLPTTQASSIGQGSSGCVYKGQVYVEGGTWKDDCKFNCQCDDGPTGHYTCNAMCLEWNLPDVCSFMPPAPGKCCKQPTCPSNVQLQYPPNYVEQ